MAIGDGDVGTVVVLAEGPGGLCLTPEAACADPVDWRWLYEEEHVRAERERVRAEAAEARAQELRCAEVSARREAGYWKSRFEASRRRLRAVVEKTREARRAGKSALRWRSKVGRLRDLLRRAGKEVARLHKTVKALQRRNEELETELAESRATRTVLSKRSSVARARSRRSRAPGVRGVSSPAHPAGAAHSGSVSKHTSKSMTRRPMRACVPAAGTPAANGAEESTLIEIEVKAHKRVIRRPRWRRTCDCASSPVEVSAPPVPRLFPNTPYGISVWSRFLFERYASLRPLQRVSTWLADQGLPISPGTLAGSVPRFVPLFEPVADAILAHQNNAVLRHADETTWRVQALREAGRSSRAWLWISVGHDAVYFRIDPSRSAEAAHELFAEARPSTVIVCDRYSACKRLARLLGGRVILSFCWAHIRRDFIKAAAGQDELTGWCREWTRRIASIYRLNKTRLAEYDPGLERQTPAFDAAHDALTDALGSLFANAGRELDRLPSGAREGKALRSLVNHREGLSVFVDRPRVPLDNNLAERLLRCPVIARRLSFGSDSETGARFTALMYSVVGTLRLNGIDVQRWLTAWLAECAQGGGRPSHDLSPWLPWSMSEERRRDPMVPA